MYENENGTQILEKWAFYFKPWRDFEEIRIFPILDKDRKT
jgi:hypothetical protein